MAYYGWVRQVRERRAAARFAPPIWRPFVHPHHVLVELAREEFPDAKVIVIDDERSN